MDERAKRTAEYLINSTADAVDRNCVSFALEENRPRISMGRGDLILARCRPLRYDARLHRFRYLSPPRGDRPGPGPRMATLVLIRKQERTMAPRRAKPGGELNRGGTFLPNTQLPKQGAASRATATRRALIEPGVYADVPSGQAALYPAIKTFVEPDGGQTRPGQSLARNNGVTFSPD
jgi:hypothetical protein